MKNLKQHSLFRLIKSLDSTEKAYFKKFAFKRENKNNESYIIIFNVLDKQETFDIKHLSSNRKINERLRTNIHASLNMLYNTICQVLIEYRKDKSNKRKLFYMISEFDFLNEKKLLDLAEKKYIQIESFVEENDMYYFKPFVYNIRGQQLRNSIISKSNELATYINKLDQSKEVLNNNIEVSKIGLKIEEMFHRNGGIVNKNKSIKKEADLLIADIDRVMLATKNSFLYTSVLANNRFIVQMMFGRMANIEQYMENFIHYFDSNIKAIKDDAELNDILITLRNYAVVSVYLNIQSIYNETLKRLEIIQKKLSDEKFIAPLDFRILHLKVLNYALNTDTKFNRAILPKALKAMEKVSGKSQYTEALLSCMMAYMKFKSYDKALEISDTFINEQHNERIRDQYISIRIVGAIAWFKKDNHDLFESEINSIYRKLLSIENFPFQVHIVQMLKRLNKLSSRAENNELIENIVQECNDVLEKEAGSKMMKAIEIKAIAMLAFS